MSKWLSRFALLIFTSALFLPVANASECDGVLQNIVFHLPKVVGTYNPPRFIRSTKMVYNKMNPLFKNAIDELNQKYPPSVAVSALQDKLIINAENNEPADPL